MIPELEGRIITHGTAKGGSKIMVKDKGWAGQEAEAVNWGQETTWAM